MPEVDDIFVNIDDVASFDYPCVIAIGMFDGLHRGHMEVMRQALEIAEEQDAVPCVLTFDPHPSTVINMGRPPVKMMYPAEPRARMFAEAGIKKVFIKEFTRRFAVLTPRSFERFLRNKFPQLKGIVTGDNFLFGNGAKGNRRTLEEIAEKNGWVYRPVKGLRLGLRRISSSRMREALARGNMRLFSKLAGRDYTAIGTIKSGKHLGRKIGFPTLNIPWNPESKPPFGVYAAQLRKIGEDTVYEGVANYGVSPTVGKTEPLIEINLFGNDVPFGPRMKVEVTLVKFLRPEKKFKSVEMLRQSMLKDREQAMNFFYREFAKD